jgi:predicted ATPase/DNA-binding winged helix-turn-helix (wHTH) protein
MDEESFVFGSFRLIPAQRTLLEDGKPLRLGSRALDILVTLVESAGETIRKDELIARTWPDTVVDEGALRVHGAALRKALGDGRAGRRYIANNPGRGYSFVAPVTREQQQPAPTAPAGATVSGNLPAPLTGIVGRSKVIAALATQLAQRRFLTIVGPGGIGKTTVAVAIAESVSASFRDGVWFVELASLADPDLVPSALAAVFGISLPGLNPVSGLTGWLRDKRALIVLDCCEHVIGAAAALAEEVLRAAPRTSILATSREPLRAEGEWLHRLASLAFPPRAVDLSPAEALRYPAVELFDDRARAVVDRFTLGEGDIPAVLEICRKLDGVPLAIELATARVDAFGLKDLSARLDDRFALLTKGRRTALPRHQTLRATMDWSYEVLPEIEQIILRRLAVFPGDFTIDAAAVVGADGRIGSADVFEAIANLATKSLISTDISSNVTNHRLLDTTRAYAREKLSESSELEAIARRHAEYYRHLFERSEIELARRPTAEWLDDYGRQIDNLRAALDWAFSPGGDASIGVASTAAAVPLWMRLSLFDECRGRAEQALAALASGSNRDARSEMQLHAALADSLIFAKGAVPEIGAAWAKVIEIADTLDDDEYRLRAMSGLWNFYNDSGEYRSALVQAQKIRSLAEKWPDPKTIALISERMIGVSQHFLGDHPSARRHLQRVLAEYVPSDRSGQIIRFQFDLRLRTRVPLARVLWLQGFVEQAMSTARESLEDARAADHANSLCYSLALAACPIALLVGDLAAADHYVTMLDRSTNQGLVRWHACTLGYQGALAIERGYVMSGLSLLREGFNELGDDWFAAFNMAVLMSEALGRAGEIDEGLVAVDKAIERSERTEGRWLLSDLLRVKGELLMLQEAATAAAAAEDLFRLAIDWACRQGALSWELRAAMSLARLWRDQHRIKEARTLLGSVYGRFTEGFATADLQKAGSLLQQLA